MILPKLNLTRFKLNHLE